MKSNLCFWTDSLANLSATSKPFPLLRKKVFHRNWNAMPLITWSINLVNLINLSGFYVNVLCMLVHSLTLRTARVWATSLLLSVLSWQMPGEVRGRQPHPVSLYPADGAGLQLCYLSLAVLSSTSSRVHYRAIKKKQKKKQRFADVSQKWQ